MNRAIAYLRLSKEDGEKNESNSIKNQRDIIKRFVERKEGITIIGECVDDGCSGVNTDRPGFSEMMRMIGNGEADCVIVKDLSRFSRNYIDGGRYIENIFPAMNIRFIAVTDGYDSNDERCRRDNIIIPFKNLLNDSYLRDISIKIRSNLEVKRRRGDFTGAFAVYGYMKGGDKNRLIIDEYAAEKVRKIFMMKIEGYSNQAIADRLNEKNILSPMDYKTAVGLKYTTSFKKNERSKWTHTAVIRILRNEIYTGVLEQGKSGTPNYKIKTNFKKDKEEWIRVENNHEGIIDKFIFEAVQRALNEDSRVCAGEKKVGIFSGKMICGKCGAAVVKKNGRYACKGEKNCGNIVGADIENGIGKIFEVLGAEKADRTLSSLFIDKIEIFGKERAEVTLLCRDIFNGESEQKKEER